MSDKVQPKAIRGVKKIGSKAKSFAKKPIAKKLLFLVVILAIGYGIFVLGQRSGAKNQKALDAKTNATRTGSRRPSSSNLSRKTTLGTVTTVNGKTIEITPRQGDKVKVTIDDTTQITGSDGKKADAGALKKDEKVIVTSKVNADKSLTAQRIRIQRTK